MDEGDGPDATQGTFPVDLAFVSLLACAGLLVSLYPELNVSVIGFLSSLAVLSIAPGYAFVAALYPDDEATGIDWRKRWFLAVCVSFVIVPALGLCSTTLLPAVPVTTVATALTLVLVGVAAKQRFDLPPEDRLRIPYRHAASIGYDCVVNNASRTDRAVQVLVVASLLAASAGAVYAATADTEVDDRTQFALLTADGGTVADGYPTEFTAGEAKPVVLEVTHWEDRPRRYTVIATLQRVNRSGSDTEVLTSKQIERIETKKLSTGETWSQDVDVRPTFVGDKLRLQFRLYRGDPGRGSDIGTAHRVTHLWINVSQ